jgi:hypothetical protein
MMVPMWTGPRSRRPYARSLLAFIAFGELALATTGCAQAISSAQIADQERAFYEKADKIDRGATLVDVRRILGAPTRIVRKPIEYCAKLGGSVVWEYTKFHSTNGERPLSSTHKAYCADRDGIVKAAFEIIF